MIVIDFETSDPFIGAGYGAGWTFALRGYTKPEFKLLGASIKIDDKPAEYITDLKKLASICSTQTEFIAHNAQYDIGCLLVLFKQMGYDWDWSNVTFYDTLALAKLVRQDLFNYSLENLSKEYGQTLKDKAVLCNYSWESGLYQKWYHETYDRNSHTRPKDERLFSWAITNLEHLPEQIVGDYCNSDVEATYDLYKIFMEKLTEGHTAPTIDLGKISTLLKICIDIRRKGIRVDMDHVDQTKRLLEQRTEELLRGIYDEVGYEFNVNAPAKTVEALEKVGLDGFSKTAKGNKSANKDWLAQQPQQICKDLLKVKNYQKLTRDFLAKIKTYQQIHEINGSNEHRIFPNFHLFGATATGRMSSGGYRKGQSLELAMQTIPKRGDDDEAAFYVRGVFLPEEGEQWVSADYSNQEQRLQVEFANRFRCTKAEKVLEQFKVDKFADFHQIVADICGLPRGDAKAVNLGLSYSMGEAKLCKSLGLPTAYKKTKYGIIECAGAEGKEILSKYHRFLPFMKELQTTAKDMLTEQGYIETLMGRKLYLDKPHFNGSYTQSFEYKGLSKLIQGSAADVTMQAMINAYEAGLNILLSIHDEICISTANVEKDTALLEQCMENTFDLQVPMAVDVKVGDTWGG